MHAYIPHECLGPKEARKQHQNPRELESYMAESCHMDAGNRQNSQIIHLTWRHLSTPFLRLFHFEFSAIPCAPDHLFSIISASLGGWNDYTSISSS